MDVEAPGFAITALEILNDNPSTEDKSTVKSSKKEKGKETSIEELLQLSRDNLDVEIM